MKYGKIIRKLYKHMQMETEYLLPELYRYSYPDGRDWVFDWVWFDNEIIQPMMQKKYITVIPDTSNTPMKIYKRKRFFI